MLISLAGGAVLLYLGRSLTLRHDDWHIATFHGGALEYLRPFGQHWSTFPLVLYRLTFQVVELRSYIPYLAEVVVLHLVAVAGAYALMRNRLNAPVATLAAIPLLFLGTGAENLFWAFQTGFVGSVMFGVWALYFIERRSRTAPFIASLLLLASLTSSGMGLVFLVVAAGRTMSDPSLRPRALVVAPPAAAYLVWFASVGHDPVGGDRVYIEPATARFALRGVVYATERTTGLDHLPVGYLWGLLLFVALCAVAALRIVHGRRAALAAGCLLGVIAMYILVAFVRLRIDPGYDHAVSSRHVYVAAFLLVLAIVDVLPQLGSSPARSRLLGVVVPVALLAALGCATVANLDALRVKRSEFQRDADNTRAFIAVTLTRGHEPWVDRFAGRGWMPSVADIEATVASHGSPLHDELFPGVIHPLSPAAKEQGLLELIGDGFRVEEPSRGRTIARVVTAHRPSSGVSSAGSCARARFGPDSAAWILGLPAAARVRVTSPSPLAARLFLVRGGGAAGRMIDAEFDAGSPQDVVIPDIGDGRLWELGVDSRPAPGAVKLCVLLADGDASQGDPRVVVKRWE